MQELSLAQAVPPTQAPDPQVFVESTRNHIGRHAKPADRAIAVEQFEADIEAAASPAVVLFLCRVYRRIYGGK